MFIEDLQFLLVGRAEFQKRSVEREREKVDLCLPFDSLTEVIERCGRHTFLIGITEGHIVTGQSTGFLLHLRI